MQRNSYWGGHPLHIHGSISPSRGSKAWQNETYGHFSVRNRVHVADSHGSQYYENGATPFAIKWNHCAGGLGVLRFFSTEIRHFKSDMSRILCWWNWNVACSYEPHVNHIWTTHRAPRAPARRRSRSVAPRCPGGRRSARSRCGRPSPPRDRASRCPPPLYNTTSLDCSGWLCCHLRWAFFSGHERAIENGWF